ncbi:DUF4439 domain-containing protein, partial [Cellulomonas shaoxiangyii]
MDRPAAPAPARRPRTRARLRAAVALAAVLPLAACGLRLETPPPVEPSPDALEQVRARTVADALDLAADADALAAVVPEGPERTVLLDVAAFSARHAEAAGGVYDSGLPDPAPTASASTSTTTTPAGAPDAATLLAELVDDAAVAADDADTVTDGPLARLVASVATSRDELADRLSAATALPRPAAGAAADGAPDGSADEADQATPGVTPGATASASSSPGGEAPGTGTAALVALALAHDEAAYGYEVVAARVSDDARARAVEAAARHRADANRWAATAGVAGRAGDPRRAAYALPGGLDDPAVLDDLVRRLESGVADAYA